MANKKLGDTRKGDALLVPVVAVLLGFAVGSVVVMITGKSPLVMFNAMRNNFV